MSKSHHIVVALGGKLDARECLVFTDKVRAWDALSVLREVYPGAAVYLWAVDADDAPGPLLQAALDKAAGKRAQREMFPEETDHAEN